jgi:hypothetical protein
MGPAFIPHLGDLGLVSALFTLVPLVVCYDALALVPLWSRTAVIMGSHWSRCGQALVLLWLSSCCIYLIRHILPVVLCSFPHPSPFHLPRFSQVR